MRRSFVMLAVTAAALTITGCAGFNGGTTVAGPSQMVMPVLKGNVHGGQSPISNATIQVYQAGTTGYGAGAVALIGATGCVATNSCVSSIKTDAGGNFSVTGQYSCTSGSQLYIVATGGNPGGGTNTASNLMTGMGLCDTAPSIPFLQINEVTTVATVWALSPFMTDTGGVVNVGTSSTNTAGLAQAFSDIASLASVTGGYATVSTTNVIAPTQEVYAIANVLASCVNSTGISDAGQACQNLFTYTGVGNGGDTIGAAISMARNPGTQVSNLLALGSGNPPFATTFTAANDLTLAVTYSGNGLNAPSALAIDATGNVFVANSSGNSVTELTHSGAAATGSPFTAGNTMNAPSALAIDTTGNVWVANSGTTTLTELTSLGASPAYTTISGGGLSGPSSIAFDGLGNAWVTNYNNSIVSEFTSGGTPVSSTGYTVSGVSSPIGVAINPK